MAYSRQAYDSRSPHDPERTRPAWDPIQRSHYAAMPSPSHSHMASPGLFEPESESSDVSDNPGEDYHTRMQSTFPTSLPPPPSKYVSESLDTIETRLRELSRVDDLNIRKREQLKAKRARKDDRIQRKREAQDLKIKAIIDARVRRDDRISRRRKQEDDAFERFHRDLDREEEDLRLRQKRLKRGLPVDDMTGDSRISSASMSPPGPGYASVPPPAKRHQTGPPGTNDSPVTSTPRPVSQNPPSAPNSTGPNPPPYAFLQSSHPPTSVPYGRSPTISSLSPSNSSGPFQPTPRSHQQPPPEPSPFNINGHPPSPHMSRPSIPPTGSMLNTAPPPRQVSSYDTRPPPPSMSSGFATINAPPASGFAPINPRNTATPPAPASVPLAKLSDHERVNGHARPYATEGTPTGGSGATGSKRTPSTTHPYQMSEAFANRHHHCEREDHLKRGIWTSYGPSGTKEIPTGPSQEMYLRCNHDGCRRIDWRTVHGLQCHIVKNHEQPKGTIGSLEKALDRYGVPVAEVEAHEREHGEGSGGTMADPKNMKLKTKRESTEKPDQLRRSYGPQSTPNIYRAPAPMPLENAGHPYQDSPASVRSLPRNDTEDSEPDSRTTPVHLAAKPAQPRSGFAAVNGQNHWSIAPGSKPAEPKDHEMRDAPVSPHMSGSGNVPPKRDPGFWKMWPEAQGHTKTESGGVKPPTNHVHTPIRGAPTPTPIDPPQANASSHDRIGFPALVTAPAVQPLSTPLMGTQPASKPVATSANGGNKGDQLKSITPLKSAAEDRPVTTKSEIVQNDSVTGSSAQLNTATQQDEAPAVQEVHREPEKAKVDIVELGRAEPKSPEVVSRRQSIIGVRRIASRRSSGAVSKEKEREREREEAALAAAKAEAEAEAEKERERQELEEAQRNAGADPDQEVEKDGDMDREEESDDPDTITAVSSLSSRDKDRERDKDGKENKTTPRRQANGRFVRKTR